MENMFMFTENEKINLNYLRRRRLKTWLKNNVIVPSSIHLALFCYKYYVESRNI